MGNPKCTVPAIKTTSEIGFPHATRRKTGIRTKRVTLIKYGCNDAIRSADPDVVRTDALSSLHLRRMEHFRRNPRRIDANALHHVRQRVSDALMAVDAGLSGIQPLQMLFVGTTALD